MKSLTQYIKESNYLSSQYLSLDKIWDIFANITPEDYDKGKHIKGTENVCKSILNLQNAGVLEKEFKTADWRFICGKNKAFLIIGGHKKPYNCYIIKPDNKIDVEGPAIVIERDKNIYTEHYYFEDGTFEHGDWVIYELPKDIEEKILSFLK